MPNPQSEYVCPRCLYTTTLRDRMKRHFETLKKPCPNRTGVQLTNEIKNEVLLSHIYVALRPVSPQPIQDKSGQAQTVHKTINNFNTINNIVSNMESMEKIKMIADHQGIRQIDFEDHLERDFQHRLERLEQDKFVGGYCLNHDGLLKLVDGATRMEDDDLNRFSVLFDKTLNRVKILSCGKWDTYLEEIGIKEIIRLLKSYFLDSYELYLIKHLHGTDLKKDRVSMREHLDIYYKLIATFELDAIICSQTDQMVLGYILKENNEFYLADYYGKIFRDIKNTTKISDKNKIKRMITNIVKENSTHNLNKVNKIMLDLVKTDKEFLKQLIETRKLPMNLSEIEI